MIEKTKTRSVQGSPFANFLAGASGDAGRSPDIPMSGVPAHDADEVVQLGKRLSAAIKANIKYDRKRTHAKRGEDLSGESYYRAAELDAYDQVLALRQLLTSTEARSLQGAAIQICEAMNRASSLNDLNQTRDSECDGELRAIDRLLWSALNTLRTFTGNRLPDTVSLLVGKNLDPWQSAEKRLRQVKRRNP